MQSSTLQTLLLTIVLTGVLALPAEAQRTSGAVGLGGQIGEPSGLTLKVYNESAPSYDFLAAWSFADDFFFLNAHAQWNQNLNAQNVNQGFEWFFGPGAFIGVADRDNSQDDEAVLGVSGRIGLNFIVNRQFEIYGQVTPRISVIPDTEGDVGGGLGFRYYF